MAVSPESFARAHSATILRNRRKTNQRPHKSTQAINQKKEKNEEKNHPVNAKQEKKKPMKKNVKNVKGNATTASQLVEERRCIVRIL
jgi:hypothetical protein